ncbi:MAG: glycosyltransferase [Flexistipes sinusarabici]|uniref:Glycosyltransferase n=2 Tax=Flexistipes sinusarabici TaxID=2352 RepID=A0A5D0MNP4_FLESI|nr:MAG: glycosyltransferase [Flexistipes sinusarabici]
MLFLPGTEGRKGEGGLRTEGYFKHSYVKRECERESERPNTVTDTNTNTNTNANTSHLTSNNNSWYITDSDNKPIKPAPPEIQQKINQYTTNQSTINQLPLISIITVVFNGEEYLEETILSVINQTYPNVEYIIIDGGSTDGTVDIIKKYEHAIDYWVSEPDKGIYDAMNKGIKLLTGEWVNFMNAGDKLLYLDHLSLVNCKTTNTCYYVKETEKLKKKESLTKLYLTHNTPCHQSVFYLRKELELYDLNYPIIADFEQMTRVCSKSFKPVYTKHLIFSAEAGFSYENTKDKSWKNLKARNYIVKKNMGLFYFTLALLHSLRIKFKKILSNLWD